MTVFVDTSAFYSVLDRDDEHHEAAAAHDCADRGQCLVVDWRIHQAGRDTATRGSTQLHGLELSTFGTTTADIKNQLLEWGVADTKIGIDKLDFYGFTALQQQKLPA